MKAIVSAGADRPREGSPAPARRASSTTALQWRWLELVGICALAGSIGWHCGKWHQQHQNIVEDVTRCALLAGEGPGGACPPCAAQLPNNLLLMASLLHGIAAAFWRSPTVPSRLLANFDGAWWLRSGDKHGQLRCCAAVQNCMVGIRAKLLIE